MSMSEAFKYSSINKNLIDSLIKGYIYCASLEKLNDPLDCRVDLVAAIKRAISKSKGKAKENLQGLLDSNDFIDSITKKVTEVGICSFSRQLLMPMMWSHYADEHKGLCLLYRIPDAFINFDQNRIIGTSTMIYGDNIFTDSLVEAAEGLSDVEVTEIYKSIVVPLFTAKGQDWDVEDEWRIIREFPGPLVIERKWLAQICFGMATPERDKELIRNIVERCEYEIEFCEIQRSDTNFSLEAIDL
ncbi:hypothetical protein BMS3Bbin11_01146 [bacterium BMS3Bbin11]|nr:hypothetical protein BMS3Bbin11_01146 [bacterium BMS3Bbin11]